jgi:AcrR family transcriptional regulator
MLGNAFKSKRGRFRTFDPEFAARAALRVFWEEGYEGATISALKTAMGGICSPSLYAAFGSKQELFMQALAIYKRDELSPAQEVLLSANAIQAVSAYMRQAVIRFTSADKPKGCLVDLGIVNFSASSRDIQRHLHGLRMETMTLLQNCLQRGQCEGNVPPGIDAVRVSRFLCTLLQGLSIQARDGATPEQLLRVVEDGMGICTCLVDDARTLDLQ